MSEIVPPEVPRASTGIEGLDRILGGGFPTHEIYLVEGEPGTGKSLIVSRASRPSPVVPRQIRLFNGRS